MANNTHSHTADVSNVTSTVAKTDDGTVQINFIVPWETVNKTREQVLKEIAENMTIPGFRKGNAPLEMVKEKADKTDLIQHTLGHILPEALGKSIEKHKLKIAIYPKFELGKAEENQDWEVKALTCELPEVEIGDYKKNIQAEVRASLLIKSDKDSKDKKDLSTTKQEPTVEEKRNLVVKALLTSTKVTIPNILIEEEVSSRLSSLLERVEKLGLSLEGYLGSIGKTPQSLRDEYKKQAEETLKLDLAFAKIISEEKTEVSEKEVEEAIKATSADPIMLERANDPEQKSIVKRILQKQKALDGLVALI